MFRIRHFRFTAILLSVLVLLATGSASQAQQSILSTETGQEEAVLQTIDNPEAVRELVSRLTDNEVRALLLEHLDAVATEQAANESSNDVNLFSLVTTSIPISVQAAVSTFPTMISGQNQLFRLFIESLGPNGLIKIIGSFLIAICAGLIVEFLVISLPKKWRNKVKESTSSEYSLQETLKLLSLRFALDFSGLLAFIIVTQIVLRQLTEPNAQFIMHHVLWNLVLIPRLFSVVLKFVFAPKRPDLRLIHTTDNSAAFLHRHLVSVALLIGITLSIMDLNTVPGAMQLEKNRIGFWFNLIIHLYFFFIAWRSRHTLIDIINGKYDDATPMEKKVARFYPYYALLVIVSSWTLVEVLVARDQLHLVAQGVQYSTMFILLLAPILDTAIRSLVMHMTPAIVGTGKSAQRAYVSTKRSYVRIGRLIVMLFVLTFLTQIWGINLMDLDATDLGTRTTQKILEFVGIFASGYLLWEIATLWLNRQLAAEQTVDGVDENALPGGDGGGPGGSRLSTVLPLITWFIQTVIIIMTVLIGLGNVGIDITPLLAGAGIVGLAIGFGAQKLVADIVSGLFFLIDDAFRSGEYVNIEGTVGTVEKISLRAMQLRHHRGPVHTIPYGEIPKITNYSRDWTIMKLTFTVPFETDLIKVKKIFKNIGTELMEIPEFADDFLQPFKSQGVIQVDDVGIVVRGKFMVKPGKQFQIRKEIFQRVQNEFEKNGIQFARKEVRVKLDTPGNGDLQLTESDKKAIGAAALEASDQKPEV